MDTEHVSTKLGNLKNIYISGLVINWGMVKITLLSIFLFLILSCNSQQNSDTHYQKMVSAFLDDLYNKRSEKCFSKMDVIVLTAFKDVKLDSVFNILSDKLRKDYGGEITSTLVSYEKTFHENIPSTFLIFKVESFNKFGYYNFYINDSTNKILLVSEFAKIKQKRP